MLRKSNSQCSGEGARHYDNTATGTQCLILHMKITRKELCGLEKLSHKNCDVKYIVTGHFWWTHWASETEKTEYVLNGATPSWRYVSHK